MDFPERGHEHMQHARPLPLHLACLQKFPQCIFIFVGKLCPEVVPLVFDEIRAEIGATDRIEVGELLNRGSCGKHPDAGWSR